MSRTLCVAQPNPGGTTSEQLIPLFNSQGVRVGDRMGGDAFARLIVVQVQLRRQRAARQRELFASWARQATHREMPIATDIA